MVKQDGNAKMGSFGKPGMEKNSGSSVGESNSDSSDNDDKVVYMEFDSSSEDELA
jgi:hypothetical protein